MLWKNETTTVIIAIAITIADFGLSNELFIFADAEFRRLLSDGCVTHLLLYNVVVRIVDRDGSF